MTELIREIISRLRESIDYAEINPAEMRSWLNVAFCCDCEAVRVLDRHGRCEKCRGNSVIHRTPERQTGEVVLSTAPN